MGVYKSDSWKKASVFNPLTGDVALMTTLIGSETFLAPLEEITQETTNGNYISQWRHRVQFACSDWDAYDTLKGFKDGHIAVQAVAAAEILECANLQWYESVKIKELRKVPKPRRADGDSHFIVILEFEGDENAAIFNNVNLLHQANVNGVVVTGFVDGDGDGIADGYSTSGAMNLNFLDGQQSIESLSDVLTKFTKTIIFPLPIEILWRFDAVKNSGFANDKVLGYDFSNTLIINNESSLNTGIEKIKIELPQSIYSIVLGSPSVTTAYDIIVSKPCLRTDGSSEYIAG